MNLTPRGKTIRLQNTQNDTTNNPRVEAFLAAQAAGASTGSPTGTSSSSVSLAATAAPRILAITPDSGFSSTDLVTNVSRVTLRGSGTAGSRVYIQVDGAQVGVVTVASNGTWQWTPSVGLAEGAHRVTAYSLAADGTQLTSNAANVTIDPTAPDLALNNLAAGSDTGASASDFITQTRNLTLTGTGEAGSRLSVLLNGATIGTTTVGSNGAWSYNLPRDLADGTYQVTLRETDRAGNVTTRTQQIVVDNQGPVLGLDNLVEGSDTGASDSDFITQTRNLTVTGTGNAGATATVLLNGLEIGTVTVGPNGTWTFDLPRNLADGTYQVALRGLEDLAGNVAAVRQTIVIDNQAPQVSGAPDGIVAAASADIAGQLTLSEAASFALQTQGANGVVVLNPDGTFSYTPNAGFTGSDSFVVTITDAAGNVSTQTIDVTVRNDNGEFRVNSFTDDQQQNSSVTALADGGFVVTWQSNLQDGTGWGVYGQRYDANGTAVGSEFRVNSFTGSAQQAPSVTGLADGGYVVTWQSFTQDGSLDGVYGQRYDANGTAAGSEFRVNSYTSDFQSAPSVTALADGGFVVTWQSNGQDGSNYGIYGQRYDANGAAAGSEFRVNSFTSSYQQAPSVTALADGGFVVTWESNGTSDFAFGIFAQRYNADGTAAGSEFHVNSFTFNNQQRSSVTALADGGFVVTWDSEEQDGSGYGVYGQRYGAGGTAIGSEFRVNTTTFSHQSTPSVTALNDGGFVVTWQANLQDGSGWSIYGQRYGANGTAAGSEFLVNSTTASDQLSPGVTALADGGFVVTWESNGQDGSGNGIYARRFDANGNDFGTVLTGGVGNQLLLGGDLADRIDGGAGADTIDGGASTDRIIYGADALQVAGAVDTIRNFDASGTASSGDRIDLRDLLTSLGFANNATERALGTAFQIVDQGGGNYDLRLNADRSSDGSFETLLARIQVATGTLDQADFIFDTQAPQIAGAPDGIVAASAVITGQVTVSEPSVFGISGNPQNGRVTIGADGTYTYTPNAGFSGNDRFIIQATDAAGNVGTQIINVTVRNDNGEFQVNSFINDNQQASSVTALADGGFVVTWESNGQDGSGYGIYAQRYNADGTAAGSEFRVNSGVTGHQQRSDVTALADGGFVVTWDSENQDGSGYGTYAQRYGANGTTIGSEFRVNTTTFSHQSTPSVTALNDGGFVVTWQSNLQDGTGWGIYGQRYGANGTAAGSEFLVNGTTASDQLAPSVTALADGGFVVTWESNGQDGSGFGIYAQRYNADGTAAGSEFRVNSGVTGHQQRSDVTALADGGFVVTWDSENQDGSGYGTYAQRYGANGTAIGSEFRVNTTTFSHQSTPSVTALNDGGFVVTWQANLQDGTGWGIYGQRYGANGTAAGSEFLVNGTTASDQLAPSVTALADGGFVVTWESNGQDGSNYGIYARRFDVNGNSVGITTLTGGTGNQLLLGGDRAELIVGGAGADTIDGGGGGDRIIYGGADSLQSAGAVDLIRNFDASGTASGDRIDLHDLLTSLGFANNATVRALGTAFQIVDQGGGNYDLRIDANHSGDGSFEVLLARIQVTAGTLDAADFILT